MVIIITGASHSGKTNLAQKLLEKYNFPYLSIDHLKMGLIRSKNTLLNPLSSDENLTNYLWPIVCEIIKTVIENKQNLIVEGCYIPASWKKDFNEDYLKDIKYICLILSKDYIENHYDDIIKYANVIEKRTDDYINKKMILFENSKLLDNCIKNQLDYILIENEYLIDFDL